MLAALLSLSLSQFEASSHAQADSLPLGLLRHDDASLTGFHYADVIFAQAVADTCHLHLTLYDRLDSD